MPRVREGARARADPADASGELLSSNWPGAPGRGKVHPHPLHRAKGQRFNGEGKGSSRGVGEPPLRGRYHAGKPLAHRTPKKNLFGPAATRSFPTKQLVFTRGFLSVRVALASAAGPHASCRAAQHGACRWLVSHGIRAPSGHLHCLQVAAATPWPFKPSRTKRKTNPYLHEVVLLRCRRRT